MLKGYSKGSFVASHPSFTEIRVIYGSGDICQNTGTTSMTKFQWGTECGVDGNGADDWLARWFMAPDALTCTCVPTLLYLFIGFFPSISTSSSFEGNVGVALYTI